MIASPETAACAGNPRSAWCEASAAAAPPTQKISANAAIDSAPARRARSGRSGIDRLQRHPDDLEAARQAAKRELTQVVLGDAEDRGGVAVAGHRERVGH